MSCLVISTEEWCPQVVWGRVILCNKPFPRTQEDEEFLNLCFVFTGAQGSGKMQHCLSQWPNVNEV